MPSDISKHKHRDRSHRSRSRSRSRERHSERDRRHHPIKKEIITPDRQIKRERRSPDQHHHRSSHHRPHRDSDHDRQHDQRSRDNQDMYKHQRKRNDERRINDKRQKRHQEVDDSKFEYGKPGQDVKEEPIPEEDKSKPDYELSGKLADDTNTFRGIVVKYNEPPEARKPKLKWRLYPFKGDDSMPVLHIHRQSGYLLGRDRKVADIPIDHPSCSKQHAVLQFRSVEYTRDDGTKGRRTRPYIIDLGSANGTFVNNKQIEAQRYVELLEKDTIKFGFSSRDYVILHDNVEVSPTGAEGVD